MTQSILLMALEGEVINVRHLNGSRFVPFSKVETGFLSERAEQFSFRIVYYARADADNKSS
jgi:hypothetical protein